MEHFVALSRRYEGLAYASVSGDTFSDVAKLLLVRCCCPRPPGTKHSTILSIAADNLCRREQSSFLGIRHSLSSTAEKSGEIEGNCRSDSDRL